MSESPPNRISRPASFLRSGWPALLATLSIWTGFILVSRAAGKGILTAWDVTALRLGMGSFIALFFLPRVALPPVKTMLLLALFGGIGYACFIYSGFRLAPAVHGAVLAPGCLPFATAIVAWLWLKKLPNRRQMLALLGVLIGIILIATDTLSASGQITGWQLVGDLLFICASFSWAIFTLLLRQNPMPPLAATVATVLGGALLYLPFWWFLLPSKLSSAAHSEIALQALYQGSAGSFCCPAALRAGGAPARAANRGAGSGHGSCAGVPCCGAFTGRTTLVAGASGPDSGYCRRCAGRARQPVMLFALWNKYRTEESKPLAASFVK